MILVSKSSIMGKSPDHLCSSGNLSFMMNNSLMVMSRSRSITQQLPENTGGAVFGAAVIIAVGALLMARAQG
jgi:hypothetical protein